MKRTICLLLCLCVLGQTALAADFSDTADHWAEEYIAVCREAGLMEGVSETVFDTEGKLTVAQCAAAAARLHARLNGRAEPAKGEPWYKNYVSYMEDLGLVMPRDVNVNCTREMFMIMMDKAVPEKDMTPINEINLLPDTKDQRVLRFYRAGILTGMDEYGTFLGRLELTRAECAAMMARITDKSLRVRFRPARSDGSDAMDCLYIPAAETALTVSGYPVRAEIFTAVLDCQLEIQDAWYQLGEHPDYEKYLKEWLNKPYAYDFKRYLSEFCGQGEYTKTDWNAIDEKSGLTIADLAYENTLDWLRDHAALRALCEKYEVTLTEEQLKKVERYPGDNDVEDSGRAMYVTTALEDKYLLENLYAHYRVPEDEIVSLVARGDYICAQFVRFEKVGLDGEPLTPAEIDYIRHGAQLYADELEDRENYYYFQKMTRDLECAFTEPRMSLLYREDVSKELWHKLQSLMPLGVSRPMEEADGIYIWFVQIPGSSSGMLDEVCVNYGIDLANEDMDSFVNKGETVLSQAVNYLIPAEYAEKIFE